MESAEIRRKLTALLGNEKVVDDDLSLKAYSYDSSFMARRNRFNPDAVVFPVSTDDVVRVVRFANEFLIPVIPRGASTGETCGSVAIKGGIVMDMCRWDTIEEIDIANMQIIARPGVIHANLNDRVAEYGLVFAPDPGSSRMCTLGGMVANNAGGLRAVKYGSTENHVLGLEVVTPIGEVITTGGVRSRAIKSVSGMNLTKLFCGSEGVLGVITKMRLRLMPRPKGRGMLMAVFERKQDAPAAVLDVYRSGILPSVIEILDQSSIEAVNLFKPSLNLPQKEAILIFEVDGSPASVRDEGEMIIKALTGRAQSVEFTTDPKRMAELWEGRALVAVAATRLRADGTRIMAADDVCVPISRMAEALDRIRDIGIKNGLRVVNYGHIGDGNIHTAPVLDIDNPAEVALVDQLCEDIHRMAIEMNGSTTGEHGVGVVRAMYAEDEHGRAVDFMRSIKKVFDPNNIMNPGKLFLMEGGREAC
jgi:glycolate oxidase